MRNRILLVLLFFGGSFLNAQTAFPSRIVWLSDPDASIGDLLREFEVAREIHAPMGLWEISPRNEITDYTDIAGDSYWENLKQLRYVGFNRKVSKRVAPNDVFYGNQPYLGHIGLEYVWNHQKNGVNINGDTLVVAYIDDGADTSHPDLVGNLYINKNEIPWNGVDDDENGYIDDYQGWNSGEKSPLVFSEVSVMDGHGTNVAGVIGARGNNNKGVSGVNWHIKVLPINTYPNNLLNVESAVIRALVYAFKQKQQYLNSNKGKGINIVALNMSLGMDNAFPADAEYWCALFDSLGSVGIWSYNATTNRNIDVGINGDIPTLCQSKYLISVNASTINDEHYSSGFSDSFIELAAPGVNIYTTMPVSFEATKPYSIETGTSFASPMVAGISALIESMACSHYIALKDTQPIKAMELWRDWMRNSVAKSTSLKEKTVWGGRIDASTLFESMADWCAQNDATYLSREKVQPVSVWDLFPNPSSGHINYYSTQDGVLTFYDLLGREYGSFMIEKGQAEFSFGGVEGVYITIFRGVDGSIHKKMQNILFR